MDKFHKIQLGKAPARNLLGIQAPVLLGKVFHGFCAHILRWAQSSSVPLAGLCPQRSPEVPPHPKFWDPGMPGLPLPVQRAAITLTMTVRGFNWAFQALLCPDSETPRWWIIWAAPPPQDAVENLGTSHFHCHSNRAWSGGKVTFSALESDIFRSENGIFLLCNRSGLSIRKDGKITGRASTKARRKRGISPQFLVLSPKI